MLAVEFADIVSPLTSRSGSRTGGSGHYKSPVVPDVVVNQFPLPVAFAFTSHARLGGCTVLLGLTALRLTRVAASHVGLDEIGNPFCNPKPFAV
jgi:hypothetical protein